MHASCKSPLIDQCQHKEQLLSLPASLRTICGILHGMFHALPQVSASAVLTWLDVFVDLLLPLLEDMGRAHN